MTRTLDSYVPAAPANVRARSGMQRDIPALRHDGPPSLPRGIAAPH